MGWSTFTKEGQERTGKDWQLTCLAIDRLRAFNLVESGRFTYEQLGVQAVKGVLPFSIIREHITIKDIYTQAREEKVRLNG